MSEQQQGGIIGANSAMGQNIDETFALPPGQARLVDELIQSEQWLQRIGARQIITGIMSGDSNDVRRGVAKLRAELDAARVEGGRWAPLWGLAGLLVGAIVGMAAAAWVIAA
jgi:hypothetical protein